MRASAMASAAVFSQQTLSSGLPRLMTWLVAGFGVTLDPHIMALWFIHRALQTELSPYAMFPKPHCSS